MVVFTLVGDIEKVVETLRLQHGEFKLVMLYNSSLGAPMSWNLIVSALWLDQMKLTESIDLIARELHQELGLENMSSVSRITVLKTSDPFVRDVTNFYPVGTPIPQLTAGDISGSGFILYSQKAA